MNAWTLALGNLQSTTPKPATAVQRAYQAGRCQWCGDPLPQGHRKFCSYECTRSHHNFSRPTTRTGRKAKP